MIPITALDDPRIADYRDVARPAALHRAGLFVAEGRLVVRRLLALPRLRTRSVLVTPAAFEALADVLEPPDSPTYEHAPAPAPALAPPHDPHPRTTAPVPVYLIDQPMMSRVVGFNIHRGCLALAERPPATCLAEAHLEQVRRVVVLERVSNPDNVGGVFRSAAAFGVGLVVVGPDCSDPLYRKAIRTSMAATLQLPFVDAGPWPEAIDQLRAHGFRVVALTPTADACPLDQCPPALPRIALMVGAEGDGLTAAAMAAADIRVRIPMTGSRDSLNVAVATSIALYHFRA